MRVHPLLGIWAAAIAGVFTLAGVQLNHIGIEALVDHAIRRALEQPQNTPARPGFVLDA